MKAFRLTSPHTLELATIPRPEPGPGEVLLKVGAAGVCHSDLHLIEAPAGAFPLPMTLGHEHAGWKRLARHRTPILLFDAERAQRGDDDPRTAR